MYAITGVTGRLGRLVIDDLLDRVGGDRIVGLARDPAKLADLADRGVQTRAFDYDRPETLGAALTGIDRLLLISSSEVGKRTPQHRAVIDAARAAGVGHIVYTSILHADDNPMDLAAEHRATEEAIRASGLAHTILRNGWYTENYTASAPAALDQGVLSGSAGTGRISGASRADYAAAAAIALADDTVGNRTYELAGDDAFTLDELAAAIGEIGGKPVSYRNLPEAQYSDVLVGVGLPRPVAAMLAESDAKAATGSLFDDGRALSMLIGRPTTPWRDTVREALTPKA